MMQRNSASAPDSRPPLASARPEQGAFDTPIPVIDLTVVEHNVDRLQALCDRAGVANWPHMKTHKSVDLARLQIARGAAGITCQKLGEAEVMADGGIEDILISYNVLGARRLERLVRLAGRVRLSVACDHARIAEAYSVAFAAAGLQLRVLVECDTGRGRNGVPDPQAATALACHIDSLPELTFGGLMVYAPDGPVEGTAHFVAEARDLCRAAGLEISEVSNGGTPNLERIGAAGETSYRSGTSIYNDRMMIAAGAAAPGDCALTVYATVVSRYGDRATIDAGSKSLTSDLGRLTGFGELPDHPGARIVQLAEEHGFLDLSGCADGGPGLGEVVRILPNHACPVSNLFDRVALVRGGSSAGELTINARGRVA